MRIIVLIVAIVLSSCVTNTIEISRSFNPALAEYVYEEGDVTVSGQAYIHRNDGIIVFGARSDIWLIPKTPYADERIAKAYKGKNYIEINGDTGIKFSSTDPKYMEMRRLTKADKQGRFSFENVAKGEYFLVTVVYWKERNVNKGGSLLKHISVIDGAIDVIIDGS